MSVGLWLRRRVGYPVEAFVVYAAYLLMGALPVTWSSALYGTLGRVIGPHLPTTARARRNLTRAFPDKSAAEIETIVRGMWENLGRTVGEYPRLRDLWDDSLAEQVLAVGIEHFANLPAERRPAVLRGRHVEVVGIENFLEMRDDGEAALVFSAHYGNWEMLALGAARFGLDLSVLFRTPNNPYVARLLKRLRRGMGALLPKGVEGAIASVKVISRGGHLGMLVDQKLNRGIAVPFFGRPAMTSPTLARLAYRFRCPVYGAYVQRLSGTQFRIVMSPRLDLPDIADEEAFVEELTARVTATVEEWICAHPEQWFWLHRRWPD